MESVRIVIGQSVDVGGKRIKALQGGAVSDGASPTIHCVTIEVSDVPAPEVAVPVEKKEPSFIEKFLHS